MQLQDIVSPCQSALEEVDESSCNAERVSETIVPAQIARYQPHSPSAKPLSGASAAPVLYLGTRPPSSQAPPWNRRITSEIAHLSSMHSVASWVPGEHQIRPTSAILEQKAAQLTSMEPLYETLADYVWETVFGFCTGTCAKGKRKALVPHVQDTGKPVRKRVFAPNQFPYDVTPGTHHWLLWYSYGPPDLTEDEINADLHFELTAHLTNETNESDIGAGSRTKNSSKRFEFVWYENPRMTVPGIYHVQVFWHLLEGD